jgi:hypothetical protein
MCGAQVIAVPSAPQQYAAVSYAPMLRPIPRVARHLRTLGMLWCIFAAWRIVEGLLGMFAVRLFVYRQWNGGWPWHHTGHMPPWLHLMPIIIVFSILAAMFAAFVGWSLLTRRTYGRWLAIVAAVLVLFKIPFGTAIGIYTLWVLAPTMSGLEYDSLAEPG